MEVTAPPAWQGKTMLVICPFPEGVAAGQRLKYEQYFSDWRRAGLTVQVSPYMDLTLWQILYEPGHRFRKVRGVLRGHARRIRDLFRIPRYDIVYLHMYATPFGTTVFERLTRALAKHLVYDLEDNVIAGHGTLTRHPNPILRFLKSSGKSRYLVRKADHVVTSSPTLNDRCLQMNEQQACTYISSSVDTDRFVPATPYDNSRKVTIGWTGTFSTSEYLNLLRPVFERLGEKVDFRLKVIGNFDWELPGIDLEVVRWTAQREVEDLQAFDIGVYPLSFDDWVTGKSGLKAIQYMAFGLPTVATNVGTTPRLIRHGENGLLVQSEEDWLEALETLVRDPQLRRRLGETARRDAVAKYSIRAIAAEYRKVLESVMGQVNA